MMKPRILFLGILLLVLASLVYGDVFVVDPIVQKAKPGSNIDMGRVSPGETIELIVSPDSGYGKNSEWQQAKLGESSANGILTTDSEIGTPSLITTITIAPYANEGTYIIPMTLVGQPGKLLDETYTLELNVEKNLVNGSLSVEEIQGNVNETSTFTLLVVNDSSARVPLRIDPQLPFAWAQPLTLDMEPHSFHEIPIRVTPRFAGPKTFEITLARGDNGIILDSLKGTLVANPTLRDRYSAGLYGFPFFTISLVANYLGNAFFSFLI